MVFDPLMALGVAGNVLQFIDFGVKVTSSTYEIYTSKDGSLREFADIETVTYDFEQVSAKLQESIKLYKPESHALYILCSRCTESAETLLNALAEIKVKNGTRGKRGSVYLALKAVWSKEKIESFRRRLGEYKSELQVRVLVELREEHEVFATLQGDQIAKLDRTTRLILKTVTCNKEEFEKLSASWTSEIQYQSAEIRSCVAESSKQMAKLNRVEHEATRRRVERLASALENIMTDLRSRDIILSRSVSENSQSTCRDVQHSTMTPDSSIRPSRKIGNVFRLQRGGSDSVHKFSSMRLPWKDRLDNSRRPKDLALLTSERTSHLHCDEFEFSAYYLRRYFPLFTKRRAIYSDLPRDIVRALKRLENIQPAQLSPQAARVVEEFNSHRKLLFHPDSLWGSELQVFLWKMIVLASTLCAVLQDDRRAAALFVRFARSQEKRLSGNSYKASGHSRLQEDFLAWSEIGRAIGLCDLVVALPMNRYNRSEVPWEFPTSMETSKKLYDVDAEIISFLCHFACDADHDKRTELSKADSTAYTFLQWQDHYFSRSETVFRIAVTLNHLGIIVTASPIVFNNPYGGNNKLFAVVS